MCTSCRISLWWWFECRQGLLPACLRGRTSAKLFLYIENSWRVMLGDKRDPLGGPISLVRRVVLGSALACAGTACATSPSSTGRHVWTMQSSESGRVVHLDSAVVGEWQICFWYDSLTLQTRHPRPNPHCGDALRGRRRSSWQSTRRSLASSSASHDLLSRRVHGPACRTRDKVPSSQTFTVCRSISSCRPSSSGLGNLITWQPLAACAVTRSWVNG